MPKELEPLHQDTFKWVRKELGVDSRIETPYLWYITPEEIDSIDKDILLQSGISLGSSFKQKLFNLLTEKRRVGVTPILAANSTIFFPGIIINRNWPQVITHPDRILLQENINSVIVRSAPIYQMGADVEFLQHNFDSFAFNVRDILVDFTESVGTTLTDIYSQKKETQGTYLESHPFFIDQSGLAVISAATKEQEIAEEIRKASPTRILDSLLLRGKYNPAKQAKKLFTAQWEGVSRSAPGSGNGIRQFSDRVSRASDEFVNTNRQVIFKGFDGSWTRTTTKRLIQH